MKFTCSKEDIENAVSVAGRAVPARAAQELLGCLVLSAGGGRVSARGSSEGLAMEAAFSADVEEPGSVALNAAFLGSIARNMPDGRISVTSNAGFKTEISGGKAKFEMPGHDAQGFSEMPAIEREDGISVSLYTLKEIVQQVIFSASMEDANPLMAGVLFEVDGDELRLTAVDGHRVAVRRTALRQMYGGRRAIIPAKSLAEAVRVMSGADVKIYFMKNRVALDDGASLIVSGIIAGEYFDVGRMIKKDFESVVRASREALSRSVARAQLVSREQLDRRPVVLAAGGGSLNVSMRSATGTFDEGMEAETSGGPVRIGMNPRYLADALRAADDEDVSLYFNGGASPCVIKDAAEKYVYMILPIRIADEAPAEGAA